jgi:SAM-dependent methyltransferase
MATLATFDPKDLKAKVKAMYARVAADPHGEFHFEMGRVMAERLGYAPGDLDRIPPEATESFAGVGYYFDLADLREGETVIDLGSGSGMDTFVAALKVGKNGQVIGVDMTDAQLDKAERLRAAAGLFNVTYCKGYIDKTWCGNATADVVISNGVINLAPDKAAVFREVARLLKPRGRLAISDIVTDAQLPETVTCNADLWAACIGGAMQRDDYRTAIEAAGLRIRSVRDNTGYQFISDNARGAQQKWGVKSISLLALKP